LILAVKTLTQLFYVIDSVTCEQRTMLLSDRTPVTPKGRPYSVHTAFKKMQNAEVRAVQTLTTLCNRIERNAAAFILSMFKTNAAAWRFHSVLDSTLLQRCGVF